MHPRHLPRAGVLLTLIAIVACVSGLGPRATPAEAVEQTPAAYALRVAPEFTVSGDRWSDRSTVDVYYTWAGGACLLGDYDLSGPAAAMAASVALTKLTASVDDINARLSGGLTLRVAGEVTRADLCGQSRTLPIVVGWGALETTTEAGLAIYSTIEGAPKPAQIQFSRVFVSNEQDFTCPGADPHRDLQHIFTHELLHAIGVGHSTGPDAIMAPSSVSCEMSWTLQPDDIAALASVYPPPGPSTNAAPVTLATPTGAGTFAATPRFSAGGQALAVFNGGSIAQLEAAATQVQATGVWAQGTDGAFRLYVIGGPAFVNDAFRAAFAAGFAGPTAVTLTR